jgi:hypothetical protein
MRPQIPVWGSNPAGGAFFGGGFFGTDFTGIFSGVQRKMAN